MDNAALAHAVFDALDAGDFDRFVSFFANDAVIWHNYDQREQTLGDTRDVLKGLRALVKSARYDDRRYMSVPDGAVAQHMLRVTTLDGRLVELPAMMHIFVEGGLVRRIEEYFDYAQAAEMSGAASVHA